MATSEPIPRSQLAAGRIPPLEAGDHLDQPTFHARYEAMPKGIRAELVGGVVIMPSPLKVPHAGDHGRVTTWLGLYRDATPGVEMYDNGSVILGDDCEVQPDNSLVILGGQTHVNEEEFLVGAPELVAETASSSVSYDLHSKKRDYERRGVQEYVVVVIGRQQVVWFVREGDRFVELPPDADGILRSRIFPGLWLDPDAFFRRDAARVQEVLNAGLQTDAHRAFVERLAQRPAT